MIAEKVGRSLNQSCVDSFPRCPTSLIDFFSSYSSKSEVDHIATEGSFVNLKNPHLEMSKNMEHSHSSITNKLIDRKFLIEKGATSVRKKDPFGMENRL